MKHYPCLVLLALLGSWSPASYAMPKEEPFQLLHKIQEGPRELLDMVYEYLDPSSKLYLAFTLEKEKEEGGKEVSRFPHLQQFLKEHQAKLAKREKAILEDFGLHEKGLTAESLTMDRLTELNDRAQAELLNFLLSLPPKRRKPLQKQINKLLDLLSPQRRNNSTSFKNDEWVLAGLIHAASRGYIFTLDALYKNLPSGHRPKKYPNTVIDYDNTLIHHACKLNGEYNFERRREALEKSLRYLFKLFPYPSAYQLLPKNYLRKIPLEVCDFTDLDSSSTVHSKKLALLIFKLVHERLSETGPLDIVRASSLTLCVDLSELREWAVMEDDAEALQIIYQLLERITASPLKAVTFLNPKCQGYSEYVHARDHDTLLHIAVRYGSLQVFKLIFNRLQDQESKIFNPANKQGKTPLKIALKKIQQATDKGQTPETKYTQMAVMIQKALSKEDSQ